MRSHCATTGMECYSPVTHFGSDLGNGATRRKRVPSESFRVLAGGSSRETMDFRGKSWYREGRWRCRTRFWLPWIIRAISPRHIVQRRLYSILELNDYTCHETQARCTAQAVLYFGTKWSSLQTLSSRLFSMIQNAFFVAWGAFA